MSEGFDKLAKLLPTVYEDLAQPSVKKIGQALENVFEYGYILTLPIKLKSEKEKMTFEQNLKLYEKQLRKIPEDKICEVPPEMGVPIIDKFTYVRNEDIGKLFANLLTKASSSETIEQAHPSFITVINNLSVDEAKIINHLIDEKYMQIPFIYYIGTFLENSPKYKILSERFTSLEGRLELLFPLKINFYFDNLISNGILLCHMNKRTEDDETYDTLIELYKTFADWLNDNKDDNKNEKIEVRRGVFDITDYGLSFLQACGNYEPKD